MSHLPNNAPDPQERGQTSHNQSAQWAAAKEGWLTIVASYPNLSGCDLAVAMRLFVHFNSQTRDAWPSIRTLAAETNRNIASVCHSLQRLEKLKLLGVKHSRSQHKSNRYVPMVGEIDLDLKSLRRRKERKSAKIFRLPVRRSSVCELDTPAFANSQTEPLKEPLSKKRKY